jgi:hypothetical protein
MIPKFKGVDAGLTGVDFGGFLMDKYICSQPSAKNEQGSGWYDIAHSGNAGSIPAISYPGVPVWDYITFAQAMIACANKGKGWHLTTDIEWASLAFLAKKTGTMPHGGNANVNPPADSAYTTETAQLDKHLKAENPSYNRALPGTGPAPWAHNGLASGVYDLQGLVWQWVCMLMTADGYAQISANRNLSYEGSPVGRGTISGTNLLTCDGAGVNWKKSWETWLKYDAEEANFTVGHMLLGLTSGATAVITQLIDLGTTGLIKVRRTSTAAFADNEIVHSYASSATTLTVKGITNNGAGLIRVETTAAHGLTTGNLAAIKAVTGTTEANNSDSNVAWAVTVYDTTHFDLDGSSFANAWISGGTVYKVTGVGGVAAVNGTEVGEFAITHLGYDGQVGAFVLGDTVTGATTGHAGVVVFDSDSGDYGTLGILGATGVFQDNEELRVATVTKAIANGTAQSCQAYIAEASSGAGVLYAITGNTPTTISLSGSPANGTATFWINKTICRDITTGMTSGNRILTLRDSDNDLNAMALPATSDGSGAAVYGNDAYYFNKGSVRAALRGGYFSYGSGAGVFTLNLLYSPSSSYSSVGFRACKAL